ncbi:MAG: hypothetical protein ACKV22_22375 [Bryobacteraceae bacterium]
MQTWRRGAKKLAGAFTALVERESAEYAFTEAGSSGEFATWTRGVSWLKPFTSGSSLRFDLGGEGLGYDFPVPHNKRIGREFVRVICCFAGPQNIGVITLNRSLLHRKRGAEKLGSGGCRRRFLEASQKSSAGVENASGQEPSGSRVPDRSVRIHRPTH